MPEHKAAAGDALSVVENLTGEDGRPPTVGRCIGEYCSEFGSSPGGAEAAFYRAVRDGLVEVGWSDGHVRFSAAGGGDGG